MQLKKTTTASNGVKAGRKRCVCLFFLWIIKSDVWVTEKSQPPGGIESCWNICMCRPTLVLKRPGWKRTFADVLILILNADGKTTAAALLQLDVSPPPFLLTSTPTLPSSALQRPSQECFSPWLASLCVSLAPLTTPGPGTWRTDG